MSTPKVSVVVTAYNKEEYIGACLDTIAQQTFSDFECVIVNDGSTDKTRNIIEKYAKHDKRFRVINKENGGVSTARNAGFDAIRGEYVIILDADDFYEPHLLESLYTKITEENADIAVCNFKTFFQTMNKTGDPRIDFSLLKNKDHTSYKTDPDNLLNVLTLMFWNKLFRADFLRAHHIRNDPKLHRAQDIDAVARALVETERIAIVDEALIYYRKDTGISNVNNLYKYPYDVLRALTKVKRYLEAKSLYKKTYKSYTKFAVDHVLAALFVTEMYPVHKQMYARSKKFLADIGIKDAPDDCFTDEKSRREARMLMSVSYEAWLQSRVAELRDDREAKYISYLLGEFQRKYGEEFALRTGMEQSLSWRVTRPLRSISKTLRRR